jgi:hypothetical protein
VDTGNPDTREKQMQIPCHFLVADFFLTAQTLAIGTVLRYS